MLWVFDPAVTGSRRSGWLPLKRYPSKTAALTPYAGFRRARKALSKRRIVWTPLGPPRLSLTRWVDTNTRMLDIPPGIIYPGSAIVPIFRFKTDAGQTTELLGTGFFIVVGDFGEGARAN